MRIFVPMKKLILFLILTVAGGAALFFLMPKFLWFLPEMADPNPSEFYWVGECGLIDRPVLLRYTGKFDYYPVESGALRNEFKREDCTQCYLGDLSLLRPFVQKQGKYQDLFVEQEGAGRYKLRLVKNEQEEIHYHYRCGKNGVRPVWSSSQMYGVPVPEYGGKALTWSLGGWTVIAFLMVFVLGRKRKKR